ncbi:hypothetical protein FRB99_006307 [Tulasnella sp. 403]|nr:hypothetical protein FRB99_006307 [Tulasnella sp. 403]
MRSFAAALALTSLVTVSATVDLSSIKHLNHGPPVVPGAYIVELDAPGTLGRRSQLSAHDALYDELHKRKATYDVRQEFNTEGVFVGASVSVPSDKDLVALASIPHVVAIHPVYLHPRPKPVKSHVVTGHKDKKLPPDTYSTHVMTGVDKLHNEGIFGQGVKVGIIDTGVDYLHPALGGGFGKGFKVSHGYDFVGDAYDGTNTPIPDDDPMDCEGHGTHVSGIVGANLNEYNFTGVAPRANLGMYRVFGCDGGTPDDILIKAIERAFSDGNHVISLSLGGASGWTEAPTSVVCQRVAQAGRVVTVAAGNDGAYGTYYASAPGLGKGVISVASVENTEIDVRKFTLSNGHAPIPYYSFIPLPVDGSLPIYATSTDTTIANDACNPLPDSTPDLSGYVVVIRRGTCTFDTKVTNAAAKGAKVVLVYNNVAGPFTASSTTNFPVAGISADDGAYLVSLFVAQSGVLLTFPQTGGVSTIKSPTGGLVSSFSTFGPAYDLVFKPSVAAPGGDILSTYPRNKGLYAIESGTSMATPFVAGVAALYIQTKGKQKDTIKGALSRFETTSVAIPSSFTDGDPLQTLAQAGAGLINAYDAIHYKTLVTPAELLLNDTAHLKSTHKITVRNTSKKTQKYKITHVPAGTTKSFDPATQAAIEYPVPLLKKYAKVTLGKKSLTLKPGQSATFSVTIKPPTGLDPKTFPIYTGYIDIASPTENLHVPYQGVAASLKSMTVIDRTDLYFGVPLPVILDSAGNVQTEPTTYSCEGDDYPTIIFRLLAGSRVVYVDLVHADTTTPPRSISEADHPLDARDANLDAQPRDVAPAIRGSSASLEGRGTNTALDWLSPQKKTTPWGVKIAGTLVKLDYVPRSSVGDQTAGGYNAFSLSPPQFIDGTTVPNGSYKYLLRALKIYGNPNKASDWETWYSPVIIIKHT